MKRKLISFLLVASLLLALTPFLNIAAYAANEELAWFPASTMNLNQIAYEGYSHGDQNAIDILPNGDVFAPFTGHIAYVDPNWGYVTLQSEHEVYFADGTKGHMTVGFMHDEDVSDLYEGKRIEQGEPFYQAGGMGNGNPNAYGDHVHITVHRGKVKRGYPYGNGDVFAYDAFYLNSEKTPTIINKGVALPDNFVYNDAPRDWNGLWVELPAMSTALRDIVLIVDVSSSMEGDRFSNTKIAARQFVEQMLEAAPDTRIAIITYSGGSYVSMFSSDKEELNTIIDNTFKLEWTGTNIYNALDQARILLESSEAGRKDIVIMTDGEANRGTTGTAGDILIDEFDDHGKQKKIYVSEYGDAIYSLAQSIKEKGITVYSLGFSLAQNSDAYNLMHYIASKGPANDWYFWNITNDNIDDILFTFDDIAGTLKDKERIIISIRCPVEAAVSYDAEVLDRDNQITSFGRVNVSEALDGHEYLFTMNDRIDYKVNIRGTDTGTMDFKIIYVKGDEVTYREFINVPVTVDTKITTSETDSAEDFSLYIDTDGDGRNDKRWTAGIDETITSETESITTDDWNWAFLFGTTNDGSSIPMEQIFSDISTTDWFYEATAYVYANDLMTGVSSTRFAPNGTLTRAMLVQVLYNLEGKPAAAADGRFADVASGAWYADAVSWAAAHGIVNGYSETSFAPDSPVTREQTAAIFQRYAKYKGLDVTASGSLTQFSDASVVSAYARDAVSWAVDAGLLSGKGNGRLDPAGTAKRGEIAAILMRFCENILR